MPGSASGPGPRPPSSNCKMRALCVRRFMAAPPRSRLHSRAEFANGNVTDVWTFERNLDAADPNWTLIATSGDLPE